MAAAPGVVEQGSPVSGEGKDNEVASGLLAVEPPPPEEKVLPARLGGLGLRGGFMFPGSATSTGWEHTALFGLYYRPVEPFRPRVAYEVGIDHGSTRRSDALVTSHLYVLRGGLLVGNWSGNGRSVAPFFLTGVGAILADSSWEVTGEAGGSAVAEIEFGMGIGPPRGGWDVRAAYMVVLGSENVEGSFVIASGAKF